MNTNYNVPTLFISNEECCGCSACMNACPKEAISMEEDEYGFLFPIIDKAKCVKCNTCIIACNYKNAVNHLKEPVATYAAMNISDNIVEKSASGGAFSAFAESVLNNGGLVFGCTMERKEFSLVISHIQIEKISDLNRIQGSKYVQSNINYIYREVKTALDKCTPVLFSGTPCQVDGLYGFLGGRNNPYLYTVDLICHGVPSESFFKNYIAVEEQKRRIAIDSFNSRDKSKGWGTFVYSIEYKDKKGNRKKKPEFARCSSYYWMFLNSVIYRENCYSCPYATDKRVSNITIGDYWGIEEEHKELFEEEEFHLEKGISCVIINDAQGMSLFESTKPLLHYKRSSINKVKRHNGQLNHPSGRHHCRHEVLDLYRQEGYIGVDRWYRNHMGVKYYLYKMWEKTPGFIQRTIKRVRGNG